MEAQLNKEKKLQFLLPINVTATHSLLMDNRYIRRILVPFQCLIKLTIQVITQQMGFAQNRLIDPQVQVASADIAFV